MNQALTFGLLAGGGLLLTKALTGNSWRNIAQGHAGTVSSSGATLASSGVAGVGSAISSAAAATAAGIGKTGSVTRETWAAALLAGLGVTPTAQAISNVVAWETQEGGHWNNTATYNPLNTTQVPASGPYTNTGTQGNIKAYSSWAQGLSATIATLRNGDYGQILANLGAPTAQFEAAVSSSPWGTHF